MHFLILESVLALKDFDFFFLRGFCYRARVLARQTERDRETESEKSPPRRHGLASISSPPFSSLDFGHARTRAQREFKPLGLGLESRSTTWKSSDVVITLSAGPDIYFFF